MMARPRTPPITGPAIQALLLLLLLFESPLELLLLLLLLVLELSLGVDDDEGVEEGMLDPARSAKDTFALSLTVLVVFFK